MSLIVEPLDTSFHNRENFCSKENSIELFLKKRAHKEQKLHISDTYVLLHEEHKNEILGYFTLSNHSIILSNIPTQVARKLPKYPSVGTVLLGRMGRDCTRTPKGFGTILLKEAIKQSLERGSFFALELNAKNVKLVEYYRKFGFLQLKDCTKHLILPYSMLVNLRKDYKKSLESKANISVV